MSKINKSVSALKMKQEKEKKKEKLLKAIIIALISAIAIAALILLAVFVIKPAIEKKKIEKEREQTTAISVDISDEGYAEYRGCRMPANFVKLLLQAEAESEASCRELGVAAEIGDYKLSVPEYAFYYYRAETNQFYKVIKSITERGSNLTGFDPSKAPSAQKYPADEITWENKLTERFSEELGRKFFVFDEAIKAGFVPDAEVIKSINELIDYLSGKSTKENGYNEHIEKTYFKGMTFSMFCRADIITKYVDAYTQSKLKEKAESYTDSFVKGVFNNTPKKYKNVTVNIFPIENKKFVEEARTVKNYSGYKAFVKKMMDSKNVKAQALTESYKVTFQDIADYYGDTVAEWIFSSDRKVGDTGVVAGAVYHCLIYLNELPQVTNSSDILVAALPSNDEKTVDDAYAKAEEIYNQLDGEKMTEEAFREYLSKNVSNYEVTAYVKDFEDNVDKWIHSKDRKQGDSACIKGNKAAYIVMFLKDNPDDTFAEAKIRKDTAFDEMERHISSNKYTFSANAKVAKKSVKIAETRYLEYYDANKKNVGA